MARGDSTPRPGPPGDKAEAAPAPIVHSDAGWLLLVIVTTAYTELTSHWVLRNHDGFGTLGFDFGIYDQGLLARIICTGTRCWGAPDLHRRTLRP